MTETQKALALIWRYQDDLYRRSEATEDREARSVLRSAYRALGRAARPFGVRPVTEAQEVEMSVENDGVER